MNPKVWHIERSRESKFSPSFSVYCNTDLKKIAPYFLPAAAIIEHAENIEICEDCWNNMTKNITLRKYVENE